MYGLVYLITCKPSGKVYVGQTVQHLNRRIRGHLCALSEGSQLPLHKAIRKYGWDNFDVTVLESCDSQEALNEAEARWIALKGSFGSKGYNCTSGGEGFKVSERTRVLVSLARKGKALTAKHRLAISLAVRGSGNPFFGRRHAPETISHMKLKLSERFSGEGNPFFGKTHSEEILRHLSEVNKGKPMHPNTRAGIAKANLGNCYTKGRVIPSNHKLKYSKLTLKAVRTIKSNPEQLSQTELAKKFGVTWWAVHNVLIGRTWKEVTL